MNRSLAVLVLVAGAFVYSGSNAAARQHGWQSCAASTVVAPEHGIEVRCYANDDRRWFSVDVRPITFPEVRADDFGSQSPARWRRRLLLHGELKFDSKIGQWSAVLDGLPVGLYAATFSGEDGFQQTSLVDVSSIGIMRLNAGDRDFYVPVSVASFRSAK